MKKNLLLILLIIFSYCSLLVSGSEPEWIKISSSHAFKGTTAPKILLLKDYHLVLEEESLILNSTVRTIYLVLNDKVSDIAETVFKSPTEQLLSFDAWQIDSRRRIHKIRDSNKIETKLGSIEFYSDASMVAFIVPNVMGENIVAYESITSEKLDEPETLLLFPRDLPAEKIRITVELPDGWKLKHTIKNYSTVPLKKAGVNAYQLELNHVDKIDLAPLAPGMGMIGIEIGLQFHHKGSEPDMSWQSLAGTYSRLYAPQQIISSSLKKKVKELTDNSPSLYKKIETLARFVQQEIQYISVAIGKGRYIPHNAYETFINRYGDCKDKSTLLITLLSQINVKAYPVLCNLRGNRWVEEDFPSLLQFSHVIVAIELAPEIKPNDATILQPKKLLLFDPSNEYCPFGALPHELQGVKGLILDEATTGLVKFPESSYKNNLAHLSANLVLDEKGMLTGKIKENFYGAQRDVSNAQLKLQKLRRFRDNYILPLKQFFTPQLDDFAASESIDADKPFAIEYKMKAFVGSSFVSDQMIMLNPVFFMKLDNPIFTEKQRSVPIVFHYSFSEKLDYSLILPPGFALEDDPISKDYSNEYADYSLKISQKGNVLHVTRIYNQIHYMIPAERYADFVEFFTALFKADNENIILIK